MLRRGAVRLPRNSDCHPAKKSTSQQAPPVYPTEGWTCTRSRPNLRIIVTHNLPFRPPSMGCADRKCNQPGSWSAASPPQAISAFHSSPAWANANHPRYDCIALRHPSDLTDEGVTPDPAGQARRRQAHTRRAGSRQRSGKIDYSGDGTQIQLRHTRDEVLCYVFDGHQDVVDRGRNIDRDPRCKTD
jgi:hypothetical protein